MEALLNTGGEFTAQLGGEAMDCPLPGAKGEIANNADGDRHLQQKRRNENNPQGQGGDGL